MSLFDQEMKLFEELKRKYRPIEGYHLVLDLDAYKNGKTVINKFKFNSIEYHRVVNIEAYNKNKEIVIITSNGGNTLQYDSHDLFLMYDYDKNLVFDFIDKIPSPYKLNRTLKQQMVLLAYDLTYPKSKKPVC